MSNKLTIIMYHYVRELPYTRYPRIKALLVSEFKAQLKYLKKHYSFVTIADCLNVLQNDLELPPNSCILTFDDGYIDHFVNVFPILEKNKIQGCFFPPAKTVVTHEILDVNKIHFILASSFKNLDKLIGEIFSCLDKYRTMNHLDSNNYYKKLAVKSRYDSKEVTFIKRMLQVELPEKVRKLIVNELFQKYVTIDEESFSRELYMDLDQLKCMHRNGMYIGSHGYNHYWLDRLPVEKQEFEIEQSLQFLKKISVPTKNWAICYPYGAFNESLIKILRNKGCALGLTTEVGIANLSKENSYTLERLNTNDFPKMANT